MKAFKLVEERPVTGREMALAPGHTIGREGCEIILPDPEVSRRHAIIRRLDSGVAIEDLSSLNGTWVNGVRITEVTELAAGDEIRLGNTVCAVHESADATAASHRPPA